MQENTGADRDLAAACELWQSGRDTGSSPLRAAARVITGVPHYFDADFIRQFDATASADSRLRHHAAVLLDRLARATNHTAAGWSHRLGFASSWAGRATPGSPHADQIRAALATGTLTMPLWGVSLSPDVAATFGDRFTFEITGAFPAIVASDHSGIKQDELELITGGLYEVETVSENPTGGVNAMLRFVRVVHPDRLDTSPVDA